MHSGFATAEATTRFAASFPQPAGNRFYRQAQGLTVSSLGIGSYLGDITTAVDASYTKAVITAVEQGINFIDTSLNYRNQHSERAIGAALESLFTVGGRRREELVVCTKAGYLVPDAVPKGTSDIVGGMHCMTPKFLDDQLRRSSVNLGISTIDVLYLHNPETQLRFVSTDVFYQRTAAAFGKLEEMVAAGRIRYYGTATWDGYRRSGKPGGLSLERLVEAAHKAGGSAHHFRWIQLPFNLAMLEAYIAPPSILAAAERLGVTTVASASLLQARLASGLPAELARELGGSSDACRAIQFTRSAPGISVALTGMSKPQHVVQNMEIASVLPLGPEQFEGIVRRVDQRALHG